ncbi:dihydrofolate reductase family protein [Algoriphagus sp. NG3]|uniref:dihydrofolate reductase family protein n=1 Tax=Algoriphagus sp. NG3 TaxID=3097546 RepID=UPI002A80BA9C|nr:dihydrofolate reductase [Algoriphagus sp. NG3]WPR77373.1 dihydrofolate reductase [Algoriphagus sp. NG3]
MKTILYSALTANGNYGDSETGQLPKQEELNNLDKHAKEAGNIVMGRKTYEIFNDGEIFSGLDVVVVSSNRTFEDAKVVESPGEALKYLNLQGYDKAFVIGGVTLASVFLSENLIDELYINIEPYIESGLKLEPNDGKSLNLTLLGHREIEKSGIVQLHYKIS